MAKKIYLAGPLFSESEVRDRREQAQELRDMGFEVYNPIEANDEIGLVHDKLYLLDIEAMEACDIGIINADNLDSGTIAELGWLVAKEKQVYTLWTNWKSNTPPNLFVTGLATQGNNKIFNSNETLMSYLRENHK